MNTEEPKTEAEAFAAAAEKEAELDAKAREFRRTAKAERMVGLRFDCLDHGFVELIDYMGSDKAIEEAARVSFTGGEEEERTVEQTRGLLRYLLRHRHTTPFEMVSFKFRIVCPIFVWRQWIRHRTASVNEISGRYAKLPDLYYVPELERMQAQSKSNKQGSEATLIDNAENVRDQIEEDQTVTRDHYEELLDAGLAKELARINLPVAQYTAAVWKMDLHNLFHFLSLRLDSHAQYEIRVFAEAIADIVAQVCPIAWEAFEDYRLNGAFFSAPELHVLRALCTDAPADLDQIGLSQREQDELAAKLRAKLRLDVNVADVVELDGE
jgi:thymidylate synthase (FAD)